jgi:Berberine and berberine like
VGSLYDLITMLDAGVPDGRNYYEKANSLPELPDAAIEAIVEYGAARTTPFSQVLIQHFHGAAARVAPDATAFALRSEHYIVALISAWDAGAHDAHIAWARKGWAATEPFAMPGIYINFMSDEGDGRVRASYGANYARLARLKRVYDPGNFFQLNQNVRPAQPIDA